MKKYLAAILVFVLGVMLIPGCSGAQAPAQSNVNFRLLLSDEPNEITNFYSLNVTISSIGLQEEGSDNWTVYPINPWKTVDLTKLLGSNATEIWNGDLPAGNHTYTKVFIYTENVTGILKANGSDLPGEDATVKLPSGKLQISKPFSVNQTDSSHVVNFVFDITVIKAGNSGKYILKPQLAESGPNQPFNDVTPAGEKRGNDNKGKGNDAEQVKLEGSITELGVSETFKMMVDSETWTVDFSAAKKIVGVPDDGLTEGLEVVVEGKVVGTNSIMASAVQIKKTK